MVFLKEFSEKVNFEKNQQTTKKLAKFPRRLRVKKATMSQEEANKSAVDPDKEILIGKIVIIFLPINLNMCCRCSKEPSHRDGSFEYPQHMFWMSNKENSFQYTLLIGGLNLQFVLG